MKNLLEVKSLNTYYGESHILRDVDLNVKSGEMVCLIGRNGVGKTTLLKSLIGLLKQKKVIFICLVKISIEKHLIRGQGKEWLTFLRGEKLFHIYQLKRILC